ncbi:MAG: AI-2E family transporter [Cyclobacteriaceae bacterium]|nr:AI-2E family transporter [Cyclobacteriaceae bacterium]
MKLPNTPTNDVARTAYWFLIIGMIVFALIYFRGLIQPFILAVIVWYLIRATRNLIARIRFRDHSLPKWLTRVLSFLVTFALLWFVISVISYNVNLIIEKSSQYEHNVDSLVKSLSQLTGNVEIDSFIRAQLASVDLDIQYLATSFLNSVSALLGNTALVFVYVIFLLIEDAFMPVKLENMFERSESKGTMSEIVSRISTSINTYFAVKFMVSLLTGVISYFVLLVIGVDFAVLWAFLIFLFNFVPYVGSLVATLLPSLFAVFQFASFLPFLWVFVSVEIVQVLVGNYIEPRIMGKTLNLSPLIVLVSLAFWGYIWGVVGMILSVPIVSVLVIVMAHFPSTRSIAILFSEKGNIDSFIRIN